MSDFLTHLASRAIALAPVVRPLVRSPYEPPPTDDFKLPASIPAPAVRETPAPPASQPQVLTTSGNRHAIVGNTDVLRSPQPVIQAPALGYESPSIPVPAPMVVMEKREVIEKVVMQPVAAESVPQGGQPASIPVQDAVILPRRETKSIAPAVTVPGEPVAPRPVDRDIPVAANITAAAATQSGLRPPAGTPLQSSLPAVQAVPQVLSKPSPARNVRTENHQPAPEVTITIGRVEIRAAAPAAQAPLPAANSGPPLSLETYLRRSANKSA